MSTAATHTVLYTYLSENGRTLTATVTQESSPESLNLTGDTNSRILAFPSAVVVELSTDTVGISVTVVRLMLSLVTLGVDVDGGGICGNCLLFFPAVLLLLLGVGGWLLLLALLDFWLMVRSLS